MTHSSNEREKSSAAATSEEVRLSVLPAASYDCMRIAESPVVDVLGLVFEILNEPQTDLPTLPHPSGSAHKPSMSLMLMASSGHPRARAMGSGIPNTTGVRVNDAGSPTSDGDAAAATRSVQTVDAGDHSVGQS